jgi:hypothetical protein
MIDVEGVRARKAEHAAMLVHQPALLEPAVEELRDARGAVGVAGQQDERGVVADLCAQMDLGHRSLPRQRRGVLLWLLSLARYAP